jgi:hypothetical protein
VYDKLGRFTSEPILSNLSADRRSSPIYKQTGKCTTGPDGFGPSPFPARVETYAPTAWPRVIVPSRPSPVGVLRWVMWTETNMALKTMPIAKLQNLKSQVEAAISAKVTERRRELESELSKLA